MKDGLSKEAVERAITMLFERVCEEVDKKPEAEPEPPGEPRNAFEAAMAEAEAKKKPRRMKANPRVAYGFYHAVEHDENSYCATGKHPCEPVDAPDDWKQKPECRDAVEKSRGRKYKVLGVRGDRLWVHNSETGAIFVTHANTCRVTRKAELDVGDFVEDRANRHRGIVLDTGVKDCRDSFVVGRPNLAPTTYPRADLILLHRGG